MPGFLRQRLMERDQARMQAADEIRVAVVMLLHRLSLASGYL